jgi:lipopolysaccharide/colanic/teichoic acid biosynthesis glycosyltransferase
MPILERSHGASSTSRPYELAGIAPVAKMKLASKKQVYQVAPERGRITIFERDWLIWFVQAFVSLLGIVLVIPLMLVIALVIKLTDGGAVFYRGERVGRGKRIFRIYKFRTLAEGAEKKIGARLLSTEDGVYFTRIGKFLKRSKLDELPQLFNVIRGEMRLSGPRPIRPIFLDEFENTIARYNHRFAVPPGITGIAQLKGGYYTTARNKLRYDLIYINRRSLILDFQLVFLTLVKVFNRWFSIGFFTVFLFLFASFMPTGLLPSLYVTVFGIGLSPYLLIILLAAGLFFMKGPSQMSLHRGPINLPLILFVALSGISALCSDDVPDTLQRAGYYIVTGFLVAFLIVNSLANKSFVLLTSRVIALTSVVISVLGLFQIFLFNYTFAIASSFPKEELLESYVRATSLFGNPVVLAVYLVLGLPLLLAEVTRATGRRERDFWLICATLSFVGIFFTQTRLGLLALLVTGTAFLSRRRTHALSFVLVCLLCILFLVSLGGARFSPYETQNEISRWAREQIQIVRTIPVKTWLVGGGAMTPDLLVTDPVQQNLRQSKPKRIDEIRNMHVTLALEHGVVGWGVIVWFILSALWTMKRAHGRTKDKELQGTLWAIISALLGFLISMIAMNVFHNLTLQIFFWSLIGIGLGIVVHLDGQRRSNLIWRFGDAGDS